MARCEVFERSEVEGCGVKSCGVKSLIQKEILLPTVDSEWSDVDSSGRSDAESSGWSDVKCQKL